MTLDRLWAVAVAVLLSAPPLIAKDPEVSPGDQRLTAVEEKAVRAGVYGHGPRTTASSPGKPFKRVVVVPREIRDAFEKKPLATARLLLKIVDGGCPWDSIHAFACGYALLSTPAEAALGIPSTDEKWDDVIGETNRSTSREHARRICEQLILSLEKAQGGKKN